MSKRKNNSIDLFNYFKTQKTCVDESQTSIVTEEPKELSSKAHDVTTSIEEIPVKSNLDLGLYLNKKITNQELKKKTVN